MRSACAMGGRTRTLVAVATGTFVATFDGAVVQMVLPVLQRGLGAGVHAVQWVMTAFLLVTTAALLQPCCPRGAWATCWGGIGYGAPGWSASRSPRRPAPSSPGSAGS